MFLILGEALFLRAEADKFAAQVWEQFRLRWNTKAIYIHIRRVGGDAVGDAAHDGFVMDVVRQERRRMRDALACEFLDNAHGIPRCGGISRRFALSDTVTVE